ncbi:MAG TPA: hypothetical protein VIM73_23115 [Polyangiaceae bacterium]
MDPIQPETEPERTSALPASMHAHVRGLRGVAGVLRIEVREQPVGTLIVDNGEVEFVRELRDYEAVANFEDMESAGALFRGEINPVVASLQRRMEAGGNRALAARIILGLRTKPVLEPTRDSSQE